MANSDFGFTSAGDARFPTYELHMRGAIDHADFHTPIELIGTAAKALKRAGGILEQPHPKLLDWKDNSLTPLGIGLVNFAALKSQSFQTKDSSKLGNCSNMANSLPHRCT